MKMCFLKQSNICHKFYFRMFVFVQLKSWGQAFNFNGTWDKHTIRDLEIVVYLVKIREMIYYHMKVGLNASSSFFFLSINACFLELWDEIVRFSSLNLPLQVNKQTVFSFWRPMLHALGRKFLWKRNHPNGLPKCDSLLYSWPSQKYQTTYLWCILEN